MIEEEILVRNVNGFPENELKLMKAFIKGAVYCWCKNCKDQWFAARDLFGGDNFDWHDTPLMLLYRHYLELDHNNDYAIAEAGKAVGRLLLQVLSEDSRHYETRGSYTREYLWNGEEDY